MKRFLIIFVFVVGFSFFNFNFVNAQTGGSLKGICFVGTPATNEYSCHDLSIPGFETFCERSAGIKFNSLNECMEHLYSLKSPGCFCIETTGEEYGHYDDYFTNKENCVKNTNMRCEWKESGGGDKLANSSAKSNFPDVSVLNPLGTSKTDVIIGRVVKTGIGIIGSIALVMFIYGGLLWMTGRGNAEKTKSALQTMLWAALGVIVILGSYGLVDFVLEAFR